MVRWRGESVRWLVVSHAKVNAAHAQPVAAALDGEPVLERGREEARFGGTRGEVAGCERPNQAELHDVVSEWGTRRKVGLLYFCRGFALAWDGRRAHGRISIGAT